jgi:hypothetical protein
MRGFGGVGEKRVRLKNKRVKLSLGQARLGSWLAASVETFSCFLLLKVEAANS